RRFVAAAGNAARTSLLPLECNHRPGTDPRDAPEESGPGTRCGNRPLAAAWDAPRLSELRREPGERSLSPAGYASRSSDGRHDERCRSVPAGRIAAERPQLFGNADHRRGTAQGEEAEDLADDQDAGGRFISAQGN